VTYCAQPNFHPSRASEKVLLLLDRKILAVVFCNEDEPEEFDDAENYSDECFEGTAQVIESTEYNESEFPPLADIVPFQLITTDKTDLRDLFESFVFGEVDDYQDRDLLLDNFDPIDLLISATEIGSDEAITQARYLLADMRGKAWDAWLALSRGDAADDSISFLDEIVTAPVLDANKAWRVYRNLAESNNYELRQDFFHRVDELEEEFRIPLFEIYSEDSDSSINEEARENLGY